MELNRAFGQVLRAVRLEKGLTHECLAERAGLHHTFISMLERGGRMPSLNTILLLSEALDIAPHEMLLRLEKLKPRPRR